MQKYSRYSCNILGMESDRLILVPSSKRAVKTEVSEEETSLPCRKILNRLCRSSGLGRWSLILPSFLSMGSA